MWPFSSSSWRAIAKQKQEARDQALRSAHPFVVDEHRQFIDASASEIVEHIKNGEWTASQVLEAYIARTAFAQRQVNCVTEVMFESARLRAAALDEEFAKTKQLQGPLHGVPLSVKDLFEVTGYDTTIGFTQWANKPSSKDADLVALLQAHGAIPFVKTNVPQTMLAFECANPLWGTSLNPYNNGYSPGGSSGGEAALLAMDGSALGIGSDIGGSLRIPSAYCGIYSLKPGEGRIPDVGIKGAARSPIIRAVMGPMARSVRDIELASRVMIGAPSTTGSVAPVPYRDVQLPPKLKFGYYTEDGYLKASPACKRAVMETVDALRREGHVCEEFRLPFTHEPARDFLALQSADGFREVLSKLGPDPMDSSVFVTTLGPRLFGWVRVSAVWILQNIVGDSQFADYLRNCKRSSVGEYHHKIGCIEEHRRAMNEMVWDRHGFDGIIAPVQALPGLVHGGCEKLSSLALATIVYNALDLPVGTVPVTRVDPEKDALTAEWTEDRSGSTLMRSLCYTAKKPYYDPAAMRGLPVAIQIVGKKWEDEKVVAMMDVVDQALGKRGFGTGAWDAFEAGHAGASA